MDVLKYDVAAAVVRHARESAPDECCGLLLGPMVAASRFGRTVADIVDAAPARNIADDAASRFLIDPADHFSAIRAARGRGLEVVGFYHSHPHAPVEPSAQDLAEFSYPRHLYLIVSLRADPAEVGVFRFERGNFQRLSFVTVA